MIAMTTTQPRHTDRAETAARARFATLSTEVLHASLRTMDHLRTQEAADVCTWIRDELASRGVR